MAVIKKTENKFDVDEKELELFCMAGGNVKWCNCCVKQ